MRNRTTTMVTSVALVVAVTVGVFASASFATRGQVGQKDAIDLAGYHRMPSLRTSGSVKATTKNGVNGYALRFTATFTPPSDGEVSLDRLDGKVPDLVMRQSISYPTLSDDQEFVGPMKLPFASQTLALTVRLDGTCFEPAGRNAYRLKGFDPECTQADLALGEQSFPVTDLFVDLDSRLQEVGRDGGTWMWRARATFQDPGYAFPIVSLGQGGSTTVVVGDMAGVAGVGKVSFGGDG